MFYSHVFCLAALDPLFEQVLVVAVCPGAECVDTFVGELATVSVDEHGDQAVLFAWQLVHQLHYLVYNLLEKTECGRFSSVNDCNVTL